MNSKWEITHEKVDVAIEKIIEVAKPRKLLLFGSYVRGDIHRNSDLDILVVSGDDIESLRKESIRIRRALRGISLSMDIIVIPESQLKERAEIPGLIYREALKHGRVVYEAA